MATFKQKFGSDKVIPADNNQTPQQKQAADNPQVTQTEVTTKSSEQARTTGVPKGVEKDVWAAAEESALGLHGGFSGVGEEGKQRLIQEQYDKMVESDKQTKEWAAGSPILGDIGDGNGPND